MKAAMEARLDIVERLRKYSQSSQNSVSREAADEIERLRAALEKRTQAERDEDLAIGRELERKDAEIARLRAALMEKENSHGA